MLGSDWLLANFPLPTLAPGPCLIHSVDCGRTWLETLVTLFLLVLAELSSHVSGGLVRRCQPNLQRLVTEKRLEIALAISRQPAGG